jgi:hypothetical protein
MENRPPFPTPRMFCSPKGRMSMAAAARQMGLDPSELGDVSTAASLSWLLSVK